MNLKCPRTITFQPFGPADYEAAYRLWSQCEGIGLSDADARVPLTAYLQRNPGISQVAYDSNLLIGAVLCGHDGRRGYLNHLAVRPAFRRRGVGRGLVERCLAALATIGIAKCHLFLFTINEEGQQFWERCGWTLRQDLKLCSKMLPPPT
jgi:ribosomal protein S18 acetylase RimI-like enzyme